MMNKKTKKILIWALIFNILVIGMYSVLFLQVRKKVLESTIAIESLENNISKEKNLRFLKGVLKETVVEREKVESYFVDNDMVVGFIEKIESLGISADVALDLRGVSVEGDQKKVLKLDFKILGSFENIFYFLTLLENLPYKIQFTEAFMVRSSDSNDWEGNFKMNLLSFSQQ